MNTDEILAQLTPTQRTELDADLRAIASDLTKDYKKNPSSLSQVTRAIHLKGNVFLNVTILLYMGDKDLLHPVIEEVTKFETMDDYLAALNSDSPSKK